MAILHDEMEGKKPELLEQIEEQIVPQPESPPDARSAVVNLLGRRFNEAGLGVVPGDKSLTEEAASGGAVLRAGAERSDLRPEEEVPISERAGIKNAPYETIKDPEGKDDFSKVFDVMEAQPAIGRYIETADTAAKYHETLGTPVEGNVDFMFLKAIALKGNELKKELGEKNLGMMMDAIPPEKVLRPDWVSTIDPKSMQEMAPNINPDELSAHLAKFPDNWRASVSRIEYNPHEQGDDLSKVRRTFSSHKEGAEKPEDANFVEFSDIIFQDKSNGWTTEKAKYELSRRMAIINGFGGHVLSVPDRLDLAHIMMKRAQKPEIPAIDWPQDAEERQKLLRARMENGWGNMVANYMKDPLNMEEEEIDLVERFMGAMQKDAPPEKKKEEEPDAM